MAKVPSIYLQNYDIALISSYALQNCLDNCIKQTAKTDVSLWLGFEMSIFKMSNFVLTIYIQINSIIPSEKMETHYNGALTWNVHLLKKTTKKQKA